MNCYERRVLPWLIELGMRSREVARLRAAIVPQARGVVLEVGVGSALNLPYYGDAVERLYAIDPSEPLLRMAARRARRAPFAVELAVAAGERVPLAAESVDSVVTTFTLCSIADPLQALSEVRRVLKPEGVLFFAEHGLAPETGVQVWQRRLNPLWKKIAGGCNLDRGMDALIASAGFTLSGLEARYVRGPRVLAYVYSGSARPQRMPHAPATMNGPMPPAAAPDTAR
jgi:SAM-dependent methyltransferase